MVIKNLKNNYTFLKLVFSPIDLLNMSVKTTTKLVSILILIILAQSCTKDSSFCGDQSDKNVYYNIAGSNKAKIPYTGTDTLVFISEANDTATLIGQGKKTYYKQVVKGNGYNDCPRSTYYNYENLEFNFVSSNNLVNKITFKIYMPNNAGVPDFTYIGVDLNNNYLVQRSFEYLNSLNTPHDSIKINNIFINGFYFNDLTSKTMLYSPKYGILNFKFNNLIWTKYK